MLGVDTDNDSAFMNETVFDYCKANGLEQTRSRAYKKNDQAWVEQKNGAVVRRLVGYGRLSGLAATRALAELYASSRLYVNFFQPSFKLKTKTRDGAHVSKTYYPPATPCDRLLASQRRQRRDQGEAADAVQRTRPSASAARHSRGPAGAQRHDRKRHRRSSDVDADKASEVSAFLEGLATAWKDGEVRPTHRKKPTAQRWWRTREDPFELAWPVVEGWLISEPTVTAKELMDRLARAAPDAYASKAQLRTLQRRIKAWRAEKAKDLVLGQLRKVVEQAA